MQPEDRIRLKHLLAEAQEACKYVESISFEDFILDGKTVRAVIRSIEVIGEAASKISPDLRKTHPDIPWQKIIGMRNRLIHVYFDIDYDIVWQTLKLNLPPVIKQIQAILKLKEE
jgi:uncharacterized protein with HEPN domain